MPEGPDERRRSKRISFPCEARCYGVGETLHDAHLVDVSTTGAFLQTPTELPLGSIVLLRFEAAGRFLKLEAEVVHVKTASGMGLRFVDPTAEQRTALEQIGE
jgi:hypothetical protein